MACYASVLSLYHTLNQINNHPRPPVSLRQSHVDSLTQNLIIFQDFLEHYSTQESHDLESRITAAANAAEDIIETHIVHQINAGFTSHGGNINSVNLHKALDKVAAVMDSIKKEIIQEKAQRHHNMHRFSSPSVGAASTAAAGLNRTTLDFDDVLVNEVLDKLTGQQSSLQIVPIVGMGGIGKTTLAKYIYEKPLIVQHFDIRDWVTISQEYSRGNILQVLCPIIDGSENDLREDKLGEMLYKHLWGRRYLIVMDDIWSLDAWDQVKSFLPNNNNGSRVIITTRLSNLAFQMSGSIAFQMKFLDEDKSWNLLCQIVFGKESACPFELEDIGKDIARNCRGLPLSIAVIGGVLRNSSMTRAYWKYNLENLSSLINLENNEYCFQILRTSYKELPIYLKPCFLYMGVFPEDDVIRVSRVIKLWVSEGIVKPVGDRSLEEVAEEYFMELIDRNLIFISKFGCDGRAKLCMLHDLLRDTCTREAQKQKFLCILRLQKLSIPKGISMGRRICIYDNVEEECSSQFRRAMESASLNRSLFYATEFNAHDRRYQSLCSRLLRVYSLDITEYGSSRSEDAIYQLANLRHISLNFYPDDLSRLTSLCSRLWNLQTLTVGPFCWRRYNIAPLHIWEMPQLRHVILDSLQLSDPPHGEGIFVLENLQTLSCINNFRCAEEVTKRIPNIKTLKVDCTRVDKEEELPDLYFNNLDRLQKLESFNLCINRFGNIPNLNIVRTRGVQSLTFPHSLKKLTMSGTVLNWEELTTKIGSLPNLRVLKVYRLYCIGTEWETVEGKFCSLKFLLVDAWFSDLRIWRTDSTHFPRLEHLRLQGFKKLEEIPSCIGDIPTLKLIRMDCCSSSVIDSAQRIVDEQVDNGNEDLQVLCSDARGEQPHLIKRSAQAVE